MNIIPLKSYSFSKRVRNIKEIKLVIIHYTGMQSMRASIKRLTGSQHKVSCHYLISREGKIFQMVKDISIAWHAGKSKWCKLENLNDKSIGIELVNKGHKFGYQKFSRKQINALIKLCAQLKRKYKIKNRFILGHSDIAPLRKSDPGEKFPWVILKRKKIGIWHSLKKQKSLFKKLSKKDVRKIFFKNLYKIGYRYFDKKKPSKTDKLIIKSFQRRFRQEKVNGKVDLECLKISHNLAKNL
tara:strand:+ start:2952 stop:3674 length:723 start_codon:yes stop_codon:yes gene_type:complete